MAEIDVKNVYAALGMEMPGQTPGAAVPASQGAKDPQLTGADGGKNRQAAGAGETDSSAVPRNDGAGETDSSAAPRNDRTGDGGRPVTAPAGTGSEGRDAPHPSAAPTPSPQGEGLSGTGETDSSAAPRNDRFEDGGMSRAERAEQARLRRQREQDAAVKAAVDKALAEERDRAAAQLKEVFAKAGMTDRYNGGKAITSLEEFNAWQAKAQAERLSRELKGGNLTPESFQAAVDNSPAVQAAKAAVERLEARERAEDQAKSRAAFDAQVQSELAQIHKLDPSVNSLEDVLNLPTGQEFSRLVTENKLSFLQAFRLANADRMSQAQAMAAAEGAARQGQSKGHLRSIVSPTNSVPVEVPRGTVKIYRDLYPDWTMEQIRQDYARRVR